MHGGSAGLQCAQEGIPMLYTAVKNRHLRSVHSASDETAFWTCASERAVAEGRQT